MRVHSRWYRARTRSPEEVAGALAFIAWRVARAMLARMRRAGFTLEAGPRYFDFLSEALAFAIQVAWRVAYVRLDEAGRATFAAAVARRAAAILAENESELLGEAPRARIEARFIARVNQSFEDYGPFGHGPEGPDFGFLRCFASLLCEVVPEPDRPWVHDQVIAIEGPEAASTVARSLAGLLDPAPSRPRGRAAALP
ncbi:MAG: hypothetical protein ACXWAC_15485 [Usitatibacter sp.]